MKKNFTTAFLAAALALSAGGVFAQIEKPAEWAKDKNNCLLLAPVNGVLKETVSGASPKLLGGKIVKDPEMGEAVEFDSAPKGEINLTYKGDENVLRGKGVTLEAWVKPETTLNSGFFLNGRFGSLGFKNGCVQGDWLSFPNLKIYVEPGMEKKRLNYYPLSIPFNGLLPMIPGRWNHVAFTFDENSKILRSWVNGGIDRECELLRDGPQYMTLGKGLTRLFYDAKNVRVAGVRIRSGVHNPGQVPVVKTYLNQLPWQNKMVLTLDKIDPSLPLPITVMAILEGTSVVKTQDFSTHEPIHMEIPMPKIWSSIRPLYIKVYAGGKEVFNTVERYCNRPVPPKGKVRINPDKSISYDGKKMFPVLLYAVVAEDLPQIAGIGFTTAGAKDFGTAFFGIPSREIAMMKKWTDKAVENNLFLHFGVNASEPNAFEYVSLYRTLPKMLFWYGADEPWRDWDGLRDNYNFIRSADGEFPVVTVQCREQHMKNTAPTCDIVGCDPYPVPNVSLRSVADLTKAASKASFGLKPVWTVLGCYEPKIPTLQELRCMTVIAIASGANGLGLYSWDERTNKDRNKYHAAERPEIVQLMTTFVKDVRALEPVLVEPNTNDVLVDAEKQPAVHAAIKKAGGKTYLFLANDQRCPEKVSVSVPDQKWTQAVPLPEFGFKDTLPLSGGKGEWTLPALAAGVFELR